MSKHIQIGKLMSITIVGCEKDAPIYLRYAVCVDGIPVGYGDMRLCVTMAQHLDRHPILAANMANIFSDEVLGSGNV